MTTYTYGDLNTDGFTYTESSDGTIWFSDANDTVQLAHKIDPTGIRYDDAQGWMIGDLPIV